MPHNPSIMINGSPEGDTLRAKVAGELFRLRDDLEEIGSALCGDDHILGRYMTLLQRLDELGQRSCWLGELVNAEDPVARVDDITLQSLMDRLRN